MLTLLRRVVHRPLLSNSCPLIVARYSSEPPPKDDAVSTSSKKLQGVLEEVATENTPAREQLAPVQPRPRWKAFHRNQFIRPHDFSYTARVNTGPPPRRKANVAPPTAVARYNDVFYQLDIDPLSQAMSPDILTPYVSEMGKIYGRNHTRLTSKTQRRLGKAIRRAKTMGMIPIYSKAQGLISQVVRRRSPTSMLT